MVIMMVVMMAVMMMVKMMMEMMKVTDGDGQGTWPLPNPGISTMAWGG